MKKRTNVLTTLTSLLLSLALITSFMGCPDPAAVAVESVSVNETASVEIGGTVTLTATVTPEDAADKSVTWSITGDADITIDSATGVVTAASTATAGDTATITVTTTDGAYTDTCEVTVVAEGSLPAEPEQDEASSLYVNFGTTRPSVITDSDTGPYTDLELTTDENTTGGLLTLTATVVKYKAPGLQGTLKFKLPSLQGPYTVTAATRNTGSSADGIQRYAVVVDGNDTILAISPLNPREAGTSTYTLSYTYSGTDIQDLYIMGAQVSGDGTAAAPAVGTVATNVGLNYASISYSGYAKSDTTAPEDVKGISATPNNTTGVIDVSWTNPADIDFDHSEITFTPAATGVTQPISVAKTETTSSIKGLAYGVEYTFTVKTFDSSSNSSTGLTATATLTDVTAPADVVDLNVAVSTTAFTLTWNDPKDEDFKEVQVSFTPASETVTQPIVVAKDVKTAVVSGLASGTAYTFTVKAVDNTGNISTGASAEPATLSAEQSSDATLKQLSLGEAVDLGQTFASDVISYTTATTYDKIGLISVTAEANHTAATLKTTVPETYVIGENTITVEVIAENGTKQTYTVKVTVSAVHVESVSVVETANVQIGKTVELSATVSPANATDKSVTWSITGDADITIDSATGVVTAAAIATAGDTATVTVTTTDGAKTDVCTVTVTAAPSATSGSIVLTDRSAADDPIIAAGISTTAVTLTSDITVTSSPLTLTLSAAGTGVGATKGTPAYKYVASKGLCIKRDTLKVSGIQGNVTATIKWYMNSTTARNLEVTVGADGTPVITAAPLGAGDCEDYVVTFDAGEGKDLYIGASNELYIKSIIVAPAQ